MSIMSEEALTNDNADTQDWERHAPGGSAKHCCENTRLFFAHFICT